VPDVVAFRPGEVFHGRYTIVRRMAAGGMGAVYEVVHGGTQRRCAMKVMLPSLVTNEDLRARFQSEATLAARIGSEHIVDVLDAGVDETTGVPFLVMELLEGTELGSRIKKDGAISVAETLALLQQASLALAKTHAAGIIHRDLKPENMFVTRRDDGSPRLKILDFGIARVVAESGHATNHTGMLGTPAYMAPEQIDARAPLGPTADVFALAHVAYTMLVGERYWQEESDGGAYRLILDVMAGLPEPPTARALRRRGVVLPAAFDAWFLRATSRKPEDRFPSAAALVAALAELMGAPALDGMSAPASVTAPGPLPGQPSAPIPPTLLPTAPAAHTMPMPPASAAAAHPVLAEPSVGGARPVLVASSAGPAEPSGGTGGTTTMPVSSEAITHRIEAPGSKPSWLPLAVGAGIGLVLAVLGWFGVQSLRGAPADASRSAAATAAASTALVAASSSTSIGASPTTIATASPSATASSSASAIAAPPRDPGGKGRAAPTASTRKPKALDQL
jgi:serine/threonine-protein kinase